MFCPKCGTSLGIDFRESFAPNWRGYGMSARALYGVDLDTLKYEKADGNSKVEPAGDSSGIWWDEAKGCMK